MVNKYAIGILVLVLLTASIYILIPNNVRSDVGKTYSTFKVWENDSWVLAGQEYSLMFDGTTKMRASSRNVESFVDGNIVTIIRTANFKNNVTVIDTYTFDGNEEDIELFPISHDINVLNGEGYLLVYEVTKLDYSGETIKNILSPQEFGHKMRIEWEDGNYYSRIWGYANRDEGKLTVKYRPDSADFTKQVRLFDPPEKNKERGLGWDRICNNGICNLILYSGIRNIYEDNQWKRIEDARSLKDKGFNIVYLENDEDFILEVIDFNYTELEMIAQFVGDPIDYPEFCVVKTPNVEFKCQFKNTIKWDDEFGVEQTLKYDLKYEMKNEIMIANDSKFSYKGYPFGKKFKFGGNSTELFLQDADTENLDDAHMKSDTPIQNTGAFSYTYVSSAETDYTIDGFSTFIKWNVSTIVDAKVLEAEAGVYRTSDNMEAGECFNVTTWYIFEYPDYDIAGEPWNESSLGYAVRPTSSQYINSTDFMQTHIEECDADSNHYGIWNVTNILDYSVGELRDETTTIMYVAKATNGTPTDSDTITYRTKEGGSPAPYLNITYFIRDSPTITLSAPPDATEIVGLTEQDFSCNVSDNGGIVNVSFMWDMGGSFAIEETNTSGLNDTMYNFTATPTGYGDYTWGCQACDNEGWCTTTDPRNFNVSGKDIIITDPTTELPKAVNSSDNITLTFLFQEDAINITSGVTWESAFIGGSNAPIVSDYGLNGTTDTVEVPTTCSDATYASSIEAYSNWTTTGSGTVKVTELWQWLSTSTSNPMEWKVYLPNGTAIPGATATLSSATRSLGWYSATLATPFDMELGDSIIIGMEITTAQTIRRDTSSNCVDYLPNQGTWYVSPGNSILDASVPFGTQSSYHYGIWGLGFEYYGDVDEFGYVTNVGWQANVTVPVFAEGLKDLFINATYDAETVEETESNAINYGGEPEDTCTCPGAGNNWEVNMSHNCNLTVACTLTTGNLSWIGSSGYFNCSANLNLTNRDAPPSATTFYFSTGCDLIRLIVLILLPATIFKRKRNLKLTWK